MASLDAVLRLLLWADEEAAEEEKREERLPLPPPPPADRPLEPDPTPPPDPSARDMGALSTLCEIVNGWRTPTVFPS
jgi:hypothetical protein